VTGAFDVQLELEIQVPTRDWNITGKLNLKLNVKPQAELPVIMMLLPLALALAFQHATGSAANWAAVTRKGIHLVD
jgi:hypothetical protein